MNKKRAKVNFILTFLLLIIAVCLCFAQFNLPSSTNNYNGLFNSIQATSDITSGYCAVYKITSDNPTDEQVDNTISTIRQILDNLDYTASSVYKQGEYIRVEVENVDTATTNLGIIGEPKTFYISTEKLDNGVESESDLGNHFVKGKDVKNAYATTVFADVNKEYQAITIDFTENGAEKYNELAQYAIEEGGGEKGNIYFYIGGVYQTSLEITDANNSSLTFYSTGYTKDSAKAFALQIVMASNGIEIETISINQTSATLGLNVLTLTLIACALIILAIMVALPIIFGDFGFVADLSIVCSLVAGLFLLQALPITTMSISGILGYMLGEALLVVCHIIYLNKIKSEFYYLNRLQIAIKTGFKKSWQVVLDLCATTFIAAISLVFWKIPHVSTFGVGLAVGAFVSLLCTVVLLKDFVTWYVYINSKNYKRLKFTKEANNEEKN